MKLNCDYIAVNNVTSKKDVEEVRDLCRKNCTIKIFVKIQSPLAIQNLDEIADACDGIMISRDYLVNYVPKYYNYFIQKDIIKKCKQRGVPVYIIGHIFGSMINTPVPNCSEINDVVGLINDGVDGLTIGKEIMYSKHAAICTNMLSKVLFESEQLQHGKGFSYSMDHNKDNLAINWDLRARDRDNEDFIKIGLACSVYSASKMVKSSLIICITKTGKIISYLSPYDFDCPILAICSDIIYARKTIYYRGVISIEVGSLIGFECVTAKAITFAKNQNFIKKGDYIIILTVNNENCPENSNGIRIEEVL